MKKQVKDLYATYDLYVKEREDTIELIAAADTITKAKKAVKYLMEVDNHIKIVWTELQKMEPKKDLEDFPADPVKTE